VRLRPAPPLRARLRSGSAARDSIPRSPACSSRSRTPDTPNPPLARPRSSSCPSARSDSARLLPHGPTLSSVVLVDDAIAPAAQTRASLVAPVCDLHAALASVATTRLLADSRTPASLRTPRRSVHRSVGRLGCHEAFSGSTSSIGCDGVPPGNAILLNGVLLCAGHAQQRMRNAALRSARRSVSIIRIPSQRAIAHSIHIHGSSYWVLRS